MRALKRQQGGYLVEFAVCSSLFMFLMFACLEFGRAMYTWSALTLVTQRGARVAAVCPVNDQKIAEIALFGDAANNALSLAPGVGVQNVAVSYQNQNGLPTTSYPDIRFVTVSIENYTHQMLLPDLLTGLLPSEIVSPSFTTTLPAESLGFNPDSQERVCFV